MGLIMNVPDTIHKKESEECGIPKVLILETVGHLFTLLQLISLESLILLGIYFLNGKIQHNEGKYSIMKGNPT